jgi:hypothetical protein
MNGYDPALMKMKRQALALPQRPTWLIILLKLSPIVLLIIFANIGISWLIDQLGFQFYPISFKLVERAILVGVILYICLMATPFLPGIEIGLILMILLGPMGAVLVYLCTLIALTVSFGLGRVFPPRLLASILGWLHMSRAESLLRRFDTTPPEQRLEFITGDTSTNSMPALLKRRYLVLAALLNLPGNVVVGGAGGIAMLAGMSRLYSFPKYMLLISVAVLPGPILIMLSEYFS